MYTMDENYNRKQTADEIKRLATFKAVLADYDSNASAKISRKNKASTGVLS